MVTKEKSDSPMDSFIKTIKGFAEKMGYKDGQNVIFRNATGNNKLSNNKAFFGYINPEEKPIGPYYDFSLIVFPEINLNYCAVALVVGSYGFKNDLDLAKLPWTLRLFNKLRINKKGDFFFKNDFSNIEDGTVLQDLIENPKYVGIKDVIKYYKNYIQACQLIDLNNDEERLEGIEVIKCWLAQFAKLKGLASNDDERKNINSIIESIQQGCTDKELIVEKIKNILDKNRFVILQGAPGTGKTYNALKIADTCFNTAQNVFFEQFHAETSYSDFVYGISPKLDSNNLIYMPKYGILYKAIKRAIKLSTEKAIDKSVEKGSEDEIHKKYDVLLVIDEINRANLSNVLGPVFYLFEKHHDKRKVNIQIGDITLPELPENLYVIGTMNTADRSLAVVDFALRRRFTWITLRPKKLNKYPSKGCYFYKDDFNKFNELFEKYATDEELNLQPGQSYFITDSPNKSSMDPRLRYELMPLMKEYFNEGYLEKAKDEFCDYFYKRIGVLMYE